MTEKNKQKKPKLLRKDLRAKKYRSRIREMKRTEQKQMKKKNEKKRQIGQKHKINLSLSNKPNETRIKVKKKIWPEGSKIKKEPRRKRDVFRGKAKSKIGLKYKNPDRKKRMKTSSEVKIVKKIGSSERKKESAKREASNNKRKRAKRVIRQKAHKKKAIK